MRRAFLLTLLAAGSVSANYYKCEKGISSRWDGKPCAADEKQTEYDSRTKKPVEPVVRAPQIGMSAADARSLPSPWGEPTRINKTQNSTGLHEQWVYGDRRPSYLYISNGVVTAIQN